MASSVGMAAYRAFSRRSGKAAIDQKIPRPEGQLVWIHAADPQNVLAIEDLATRLCKERFGLSALITCPDPSSLHRLRLDHPSDTALIFQDVPSEHPDAVAHFIAHWRPDLCLWAWGALRPNLIVETAESACPMVLFDGDLPGFDSARDRWLPEVSRHVLGCFDACLVRIPAAARRLEVLGVEAEKIEYCAPLRPGGYALPCEDQDLSDLRDLLEGRPLWLAAGVQESEIAAVLAAHRQAVRLSHRLLLVAHPANPDLAPRLKAEAEKAGMRTADWSAGEDPEENVQMLITDDPRDLGLFYRVAPVSFLGSSLASDYGGRNPFEAAALGSAVLYGPNVRRYLPFYSKLAHAGAARIVKDAETLGAAVTQLIAPDQAAGMACAGWDVISEGAATTDRLMDIVEAVLDGEDPLDHART